MLRVSFRILVIVSVMFVFGIVIMRDLDNVSLKIKTDQASFRNGSVKFQNDLSFKSQLLPSTNLKHKPNIFVQTALYRYPFKYQNPYLLSNEGVCEFSENVSIIFLIHSAPKHFDQRQAIRSTWANNTHYLDLGVIKHLFLLGKVNDSSQRDRINDEFLKFGDILQGDFTDNYHNLSLNTLTGLRWVTEHCSNAKFVVKADDDVFVNTFRLLQNVMPKLASHTKQVYCNTFTNAVIRRDLRDKWFVDPSILPGQRFYPKYCEGKFVMLSRDIVPLLYSTAASVPLFWIEDVYIYGMVLNEIPGVKFSSYQWGREFLLSGKLAGACVRKNNCLFVTAGAKDMLSAWSEIKTSLDPQRLAKTLSTLKMS